VNQGGQPLHVQGLVEMGSDPGHRLGYLVDPALLLPDQSDSKAQGAPQQPDQDLVDDQGRKEFGIPGWDASPMSLTTALRTWASA